jgi:chromosomal replication initiation ATPase DnaA
MTLKRIGEMFNKDHTTAMHAIKTIQDRMLTDEMVRREVSELEDSI